MFVRSPAIIALTLGCCVACSDPPSVEQPTDAGTGPPPIDLVRPLAPENPRPVEAALGPQLVPCPNGWREVTSTPDGIVTCDPWPESGQAACALDEAHFPGEPACTRVGTTCPIGQYSEGLPNGVPILYVDAAAPPGGDGSIATPYANISAAVRTAQPGTVIAVAKGTYDGSFTLPADVELIGACTALTLVTASATARDQETITVGGTGVEISNVSIQGRPALRAGSTGQTFDAFVTLRDVIVRDSEFMAIIISERGDLIAENLVVRDTRPLAGDGVVARGLLVQRQATAELRRAVFSHNRDAAIAVAIGGSASITDVAITDTEPNAEGNWGFGVYVIDDSSATLSRVAVERSHYGGVVVSGRNATVAISDSVVRSSRADTRGGSGFGVYTELGARATLSRLLVEASQGAEVLAAPDSVIVAEDLVARAGAAVDDPSAWAIAVVVATNATLGLNRAMLEERGSGVAVLNRGTASIFDVHYRGLRSMDDSVAAAGLFALAGAKVDGARFLFEDITGVGLMVDSAELNVSHVAVRGVHALGNGVGGYGLYADVGARVSATSWLFERTVSVGLWATGSTTTVQLEDVVIEDVVAGEFAGYGFAFANGVQADVARARVERATGTGFAVHGSGTRVTTRDLTVKETRSGALGFDGGAIEVAFGGELNAERLLVERNRFVSIGAWGLETIATLVDVSIADTLHRECVSSSCADKGAGIGAGSYQAAAMTLERFAILRSPLVGAQLATDGTMTLREGEVSENLIGINVQSAGLELERFTDRVVYRDNQRNLDAAALFVPDVGDAIEASPIAPQ